MSTRLRLDDFLLQLVDGKPHIVKAGRLIGIAGSLVREEDGPRPNLLIGEGLVVVHASNGVARYRLQDYHADIDVWTATLLSLTGGIVA